MSTSPLLLPQRRLGYHSSTLNIRLSGSGTFIGTTLLATATISRYIPSSYSCMLWLIERGLRNSLPASPAYNYHHTRFGSTFTIPGYHIHSSFNLQTQGCNTPILIGSLNEMLHVLKIMLPVGYNLIWITATRPLHRDLGPVWTIARSLSPIDSPTRATSLLIL